MNTYKLLRHFKIISSRFSRKKECGYNYILSLGYNCEVSFRFLKFFHYEEASLFNWTFSYTVDDLIYAITHLDALGTGGFKKPDPLWECNNTHIKFHGREDMGTYLHHQETEEILKRDLDDLEGRIAHLKTKFVTIARNEKTKLYIYKIKKEDITKDVADKITDLYKALQSIGARNFTLLIVREETAGSIPPGQCYLVRSVARFAPDPSVTDKLYLANGWDDIYAEFYQNEQHQAPRKKHYKFEKKRS